MRPLYRVLLAVALSGCAGGQATTAPEAKSPPEPEVTLEVSEAKATYYKQGAPSAVRFVARQIPKNMIKSANKGNEVYVEAYDGAGKLVAYLRDFVGPVSLSESCACDPLNLTLVFDPERKFKDVIEASPLHKWGNEPLTADERTQLIEIVKTPDASLLTASSPESLVDATSGATKKEYVPHVVARAALATQRLAKLAQDTAAILVRAPLKRDEKRLQELMTGEMQAEEFVANLATFVDESESPQLRDQAYQELASRYPVVAREKALPAVERVLLNAEVRRELQVYACYVLAERQLRNEVTAACAARTSVSANDPLEARLAGTVAYNRGDYAEAVPQLEAATQQVSYLVDPGLHYRLGDAAAKSGNGLVACRVGKELYRDAPLYPNVATLLDSCDYRGGADKLKGELELVRKQRVLNGEHPSTAKVPTLNLENEKFEPIATDLTVDGKITVAVFFATWCPHCQRELPKLVEFQKKLENDAKLASKARLVAVRTLIERENEDYAAFKQRFSVNFPIYTDPAMGTAFAAFARAQGIERPGVPLVTLVDPSGDVRYILQSYEYSDTIRELEWLIEAIGKSG
ncbi:MAG: TlpA disulfide reductase family protein [Myxococcota bacterium]